MRAASCYRANYLSPQRLEFIRPTLLYNVENWIMNQKTEENCIYSEIYLVQHWKMTFGEENIEIRELFRESVIVEVIRGSRLSWVGQILRKLTKIIHESPPQGIRPLGSPRIRWKDQVRMRKLGLEEEDVRDRGRRWRVVGEAKYQLGYKDYGRMEVRNIVIH